MTDTLPRPVRPRPARASAARPGLLRAGLPAAAWALGAGFVLVAVPVLVLWAADSRSAAGAGDALRTVAQVWLLAHGAALHVPGGTFGLLPLGLLALPLLLLERAARHAAGEHEVTTLSDGGRLAAGVAGPYALVLGLVAWVAGSDAVRPDVVQALVGASLLGLLGAGTGVVRGTELGPALVAALPARLVRAAVPAAAAGAALLGAGALAAGASLAVHVARAAHLADAAGPGVFGGVGLLLLGVLYAPVLALWGTSYLVGPGVALGVGTSVGPLGTTLGAVPSFPLLAALPGPVPADLGWLVLLLPVAAGLLAAVVAERRGLGVLDALLAAPLAAVGTALLARLAAGPLGGGRLTEVGPSWWQTGLATALELALGVGAWETVRRIWPRAQARAT